MPTATAAPPPPSAAAGGPFAEEGPPEDGPHTPPCWVSLDARRGRLVCAGLDLTADQLIGRITEKRLVRVFADGHGEGEHDNEHEEGKGALCASSNRRVADHGRPGRECAGCADLRACTPRWRILWEEPGTGLAFAHTLSAADTARLTRYVLAMRREGLRLPEMVTRINVEGTCWPGTERVRWCLRFEKIDAPG